MTTTIHGWATESATAAPPAQRVTEAGAVAAAGSGLLDIVLITPGRGSSGYYSADLLQRAEAAKVWPAGTQMFIDHATDTEVRERGIRSVADLAAVLTEDARWDPTYLDPKTGQLGALRAPARPIGPNGQAMRQAEGAAATSVCAVATWGTGDGPDGLPGVIEELHPSPHNSVDFVTIPGRGGTFTVLESAQAQEGATVASYLEARTHRYLNELFADMYGDGRLTREEWDALQAAAGNAVAAITATIAALPALTERHPWADAPTNSPAVEAGAPLTNPAGDSTIQGTPHQEDDMPQIEQAELDQLRESAGRAEALATENATLKADAEKRETEAKEARVAEAEKVIRESYGENAPAFLVDAAKLAAEAGTFDAAAAREAAKAVEAHQAGQPAGLGSTTVSESAALPTDEDIANAL